MLLIFERIAESISIGIYFAYFRQIFMHGLRTDGVQGTREGRKRIQDFDHDSWTLLPNFVGTSDMKKIKSIPELIEEPITIKNQRGILQPKTNRPTEIDYHAPPMRLLEKIRPSGYYVTPSWGHFLRGDHISKICIFCALHAD